MDDEGKPATAYLNADERIVLDRYGVSISKTSLRFSKELGQSELRDVWRLVLAIRRRTPKSEDWVNWLIGAWLNETNTRLGKGTAEQIVTEEEQLQHYRQHLLQLSGATLIALQHTEHAVTICCRLLDPDQDKIAVDGVFSQDGSKRRRTLGQLCRALSARRLFVDDFEQRLNQFVSDRNRFAHRLWVENDPPGRDDFGTQLEGLRNLESFMLGLLREAHEVLRIFMGIYGAIGLAIAERDKAEDLYRRIAAEWEQDIRKFTDVYRTT